jgi:tetratricopeptide (TPR) repeat protein
MRHRYLTFLFILVFIIHGLGQNHYSDSLLTRLKNDKNDTNKVKDLNNLAHSLYSTNPDSTVLLVEQASKLASTLGYANGEAIAYYNAGIGYTVKGDYSKAIENYLKALKISEELGNKQGQASDLSNIGIVYNIQGDYPNAIDYELKGLRMDELLGDKQGQAGDLCNIGDVYENEGDFPKALDYQLKALKMSEELGYKQGQENALGNIGNIYSEEANFDKALDYYIKALKMDEELGDKAGQANDMGNIALIYNNRAEYDTALSYNIRALKLDEEVGDKNGVAHIFGNLGLLYTRTGKFKEAEDYLVKATNLEDSIGDKNTLRQLDEYMSRLYDTTNRSKLALTWYKKAMSLKDTLFNADKNKALTRKEMTYEFEKKEAAEKAEQDKKDALAEADKRKQKIIIWSVIGGFLLVLVFAGFIFRSLQITNRQKLLIERKNKVIEEKNKDILDSITYAKRLQDAILPPLSLIAKYLPESFVLYKPKDIVAGDFYWMERIGDTIFIAAADCTGHGVPGAMVSVVCSNALNRTVKEFKITEPGKILDKVRELVLETFEKSESIVQDGMDISLATLTPSKGVINMQWAGAFNSLWYIQHGEIKELAADKQPIGKTDKPLPFTTHNIELGKGDSLYLFTDGYADQFGGPKGKKFKYKQLQELIMGNSQSTMREQKNTLEQGLDNWKGNLEQVDDILIMGIRV